MIRNLLASGGFRSALQAQKWFGNSQGWGGAIAHDLMRQTGRGLFGMSQMKSNAGLGATLGGLGGGMYGAFSDDTSMIGGALKGAMLGGGIGAGATIGGHGLSSYRIRRGILNQSRGQAASAALRNMGTVSADYIGRSYSKAVNGFQGLKGAAGSFLDGAKASSGTAVTNATSGKAAAAAGAGRSSGRLQRQLARNQQTSFDYYGSAKAETDNFIRSFGSGLIGTRRLGPVGQHVAASKGMGIKGGQGNLF